MKNLSWIFIALFIYKAPVKSQDEGSIHLGVFARSESNLYKYLKQYNGGFTSVRASTGYSAGLAVDYIPFYLVKLDARISFSETNYSPDYTAQKGIYYKTNMRLSQMAVNAHFNLGSSSKIVNMSFFLGQQFNHVLKNTQIRDEDSKEEALPVNRLFTQTGLAANILLWNQKILIKPEAGLRFNVLGTKRQWENAPNQFFGGVTVAYKVRG